MNAPRAPALVDVVFLSVLFERRQQLHACTRKVDVRLPGKGNSDSHGARPVHLIITMIKWIRTCEDGVDFPRLARLAFLLAASALPLLCPALLQGSGLKF